jgi:hypothetical protein
MSEIMVQETHDSNPDIRDACARSIIDHATVVEKATGGPEIAAESIDHLVRCLTLLFGLSVSTASTTYKKRK